MSADDTHNSELDSASAFAEWLAARHPGEDEYHQAVAGVVHDILPMVRDNKGFVRGRVLQRLTEPDRVVSFRVVWEDDNGRIQINRGYRVQQTNALGPYKGGLRFDATVNQSILKFLAFEQSLKNSLTGLDLGAGKGGADFDPRGRSDAEIRRFCYSFMTELQRHIGSQVDVPAGDIGVGQREIGYLFGQYKRITNSFTSALTGKQAMAGGSCLRPEATGYGAVYFLGHMLERAGSSIDGKRIAISGAGNVAIHAAEKAHELGATIVTLSNRSGTLHREDGFSAKQIEKIKQDYPDNSDLEVLADDMDAKWNEGDKPWSVDCDVAMPSATQNELDEDDARQLIGNGCQYVIEAANMPLTSAAEDHIAESGVVIAPGKATNAGGVAVSGFEIAQNRVGMSWSKERVDEQLRDTMKRIFETCVTYGEHDDGIDYRRGANVGGFVRLADALAAAGAI